PVCVGPANYKRQGEENSGVTARVAISLLPLNCPIGLGSDLSRRVNCPIGLGSDLSPENLLIPC
ncbi:hypothetical protein ACQF5F_28075, partial [Klebsiella pneumoniae]